MADKEIPRDIWNVGGGSRPLGCPDGTEIFPCVRNSYHNPRKRQPFHKSADSQANVASPEI
jgi:hypothetical protein